MKKKINNNLCADQFLAGKKLKAILSSGWHVKVVLYLFYTKESLLNYI